MEKINIAEILRDCPRGMELYSPIFGKVYLDKIRPHLAIVVTTDKEQGDFKEEFLYDGRYEMNGECMLFPSKGKTTWEGCVPPIEFKEGDIIYTLLEGDLEFISIFKKANKTLIYTYVALSSTLYRGNINGLCKKNDIKLQRLATEEEKAELFKAIKENGYKWNAEKKSLEKLLEPKFKVGDKIKSKENRNYIYTITGIREKENKYECGVTFVLRFSEQDNWELVPNKFDITTLVPFESKVLVRESKTDAWEPAFYGFFHQRYKRFYTTSSTWLMCIPYNEDTKHLIGTTNDCNEFYKTWEERA